MIELKSDVMEVTEAAASSGKATVAQAIQRSCRVTLEGKEITAGQVDFKR